MLTKFRYQSRFIFINLIYGIRNLIKWFPIIWKNREWDHYYIYEILKFKLENQSQYLKNQGRHVSSKRDSEKMML